MITIPYGKHYIDEDDINAVVSALKSGVLTQGPIVNDFENNFASYVGSKYAVAVSSGTAALHLAYIAAGLNPESSIVTTPITFVATANAAKYVGANVILSDVDSTTANLCPDELSKTLKRNQRVKAIVPVHFAGLPCNMSAIYALSSNSDISIIEDASHALGATYLCGNKVGSCKYSLMTTFSFHPVKAIAAGEGGMITTNDETMYRKLLRLRSHGINKLNDSFINVGEAFQNGLANPWYYEQLELGFNYRLSDMQCALANSQLQKLDLFISKRKQLAHYYDECFSNIKAVTPIQTNGRSNSAHHLYVVRIQFEKLGITRGNIMRDLLSKSIGTQVHYIPIDNHPYHRKNSHEVFPNASKYYQECLSLPLYYSLTQLEQLKVVESLSKALN